MRFIYTKAFAIFAGCLVVLTILAFLQFRGWLEPLRKAALSAPKPVIFLAQSVINPLRNFFGTIYQLHKIAQENARLRSKNIELELALVTFNQEQRENEALRNELGFAKASKSSLVPCSVTSQNGFGVSDSVLLNCGSDNGVAEGQAVVSAGHLAGKIIYAGKNISTALLAVSSKFSMDAQLSQTGAPAIVKGSFGSGLVLDQLAQTQNIEKGWLVVTAGINSQVPKNILIGEAGEILSTQSDLFKKATLISPVDFNNLEFVFVVK